MRTDGINCDYPWAELVAMTHDAMSEDEKKLILEFLVRYLDFVVQPRNYVKYDIKDTRLSQFISALNAVRYSLSDPVCQQHVWDWLVGEILFMDEDMRGAAAVWIFCPILTGPVPWNDEGEMFAVDKTLQCYSDTKTRWVMLEGFSECSPQKAKNTITRYNKWREMKSLPTLQVDFKELENFLFDYGVCDDDETSQEKP